MSGRVVDLEDDTRAIMNILPITMLALTEMNNPMENSAAIQGQYLERRAMRLRTGRRSAVLIPDEPGTPYVDGRRSPSPVREGRERPGMSKSMSGFLENLPEKEAEKRKRRDEPFPARRGQGGALGIPALKGKAHEYPAEPYDKLREEVLKVSLFPNLYNKKTLLRGM